jgi:hypothetical protein
VDGACCCRAQVTFGETSALPPTFLGQGRPESGHDVIHASTWRFGGKSEPAFDAARSLGGRQLAREPAKPARRRARQLRPPRAGRMGIKGLTKLLGDNAPRCIKEHELKSYFGRKSVPPRPVSP